MARIKEGFKGERMLSLPQDILHKYSQHPLVKPLFIRKLGFFPKVKYHYVQKDQGVDYCLLLVYLVRRLQLLEYPNHHIRKIFL